METKKSENRKLPDLRIKKDGKHRSNLTWPIIIVAGFLGILFILDAVNTDPTDSGELQPQNSYESPRPAEFYYDGYFAPHETRTYTINEMAFNLDLDLYRNCFEFQTGENPWLDCSRKYTGKRGVTVQVRRKSTCEHTSNIPHYVQLWSKNYFVNL